MRAHVFPHSLLAWIPSQRIAPDATTLPPESVRIRVHGQVTDSVIRDLRVFIRQAPGGTVVIDLREAEGVDQATVERLEAMAESHDGPVRFEGVVMCESARPRRLLLEEMSA